MLSYLGSWEPFVIIVLVTLLLLWATARRRNRHQNPQNAVASLAPTFLIKPYLQLGNSPTLTVRESLELLWHAKLNSHHWQVQVRVAGESAWRNPVDVQGERCDIAKLGEHLRFVAHLDDLPPGMEFEYRLLVDGDIAFGAIGKARNASHQPLTVVAAGDLGKPKGMHGGNIHPVAYHIARLQPDFVALIGDLVYDRGKVSEYLDYFFPPYNADAAAIDVGGPVLRSRVVMPVLGNHDAALPNPADKRDFKQSPDLLGYYLFWSVPLNGPQERHGLFIPRLEGDDDHAHARFLAAAGERYPRIGCYFYDWGDVHWTVLDSNAYMDWTDEQLIAWVENDLASARYATWRVVMFHHPSFSSDGKHADEQRMRVLAPIFERWDVSLVLNGHNHCYERTLPIRFQPDKLAAPLPLHTEDTVVGGEFVLDTQYDGRINTHPHGVIYLVDGAGGAKMYPHSKPETLKPFTKVYDQSQHSFTYLKFNRRRLEAVQIAADGTEIDRFIIDK